MFYVYGLREKGSKEYRYVGRTVQPLQRLREHMAEGPRLGRTKQLDAWLKSTGYTPMMDILESSDKHDMGRQTEQYWIEKLIAAGNRLLNSWAASQTYSNFESLPETEKRDTITRYLDMFEADTDQPWLKEDGPIWAV